MAKINEKDMLMSEDKEKQWPYYFCTKCTKLSPISYKNGNRFCIKCGWVYEHGEGGKLIMFTTREAKVRNLCAMNDNTGQIDDED
jgi:hypothetical protein